jgi:hypothetical protein
MINQLPYLQIMVACADILWEQYVAGEISRTSSYVCNTCFFSVLLPPLTLWPKKILTRVIEATET